MQPPCSCERAVCIRLVQPLMLRRQPDMSLFTMFWSRRFHALKDFLGVCGTANFDWTNLTKRSAGGASRDRTDDLKLAKLALSQLSYGPVSERTPEMVGLGRLELPTSRLSSARSNQLSYKPGTSNGRDNALNSKAPNASVWFVRKERETKTAKLRKMSPKTL